MTATARVCDGATPWVDEKQYEGADCKRQPGRSGRLVVDSAWVDSSACDERSKSGVR